MKMKISVKLLGGFMALALIAAPSLTPSAALAATYHISGGGGGGGGGNDSNLDNGGGGGGGGGGLISNTLTPATGGAGATDNTAGGNKAGGTPGAGGVAGDPGAGAGGGGITNGIKDTGGTGFVGTGSIGGNGGTGTAGNGGAGGNATANDSDIASITAGDSISITGGSGGKGGDGAQVGPAPSTYPVGVAEGAGVSGGNGGNGGNASLGLTTTTTLTITSLSVVSGSNGGSGAGYQYWNGTSLNNNYGASGGGTAGSAAFNALGTDVTLSGPFQNIANDNTATSSIKSLTVTGAGNGITITANRSYNATVTITNATTVANGNTNITSNGNGAASFTTGTFTSTTGNTSITSGSTGNASMTTGNYRVNGGNTSVTSSGSNGAASFTGSGTYYTSGTTTISATGPGDATMTLTVNASNAIESAGTLTIQSTGNGNARFIADNAGTVKVSGGSQNINVTSGAGNGQASFSAANAIVTVNNDILVDASATTNSNAEATFEARGLVVSHATTIKSGTAAASMNITGTQITTADLMVTAGANTATFTAGTASIINTNHITVNGTGNASVTATNALLDTSNDNVIINANSGTGVKSINVKSLQTGDDNANQNLNGTVTMTSTGIGKALLNVNDNLQTRAINLTGNGTANDVVVNVNRLNVTHLDTTLNFTNTVAGDGTSGVYFGTIEIGQLDDTLTNSMRTLNATNAALGTYHADLLLVNGLKGAPNAGHQWTGNVAFGDSGSIQNLTVNLPSGFNVADYAIGGTNALLTVSGNVNVSDNIGLNLYAYGNENPFANINKGDVFQIVKAGSVTDNTTAPIEGVGWALGAKKYFFTLTPTANALAVMYTGHEDYSKAYLEAGIAAMNLINEGVDLEMRTMINTFDPYAANDTFKDGLGMGMMFGMEYNHSRLDSGSHVDSDDVNAVVGPAFRTAGPLGLLGLTAFFETGYSDFETKNNFQGINIFGGGDVKYYGGGLGLRNDFDCGIYLDASVRFGAVDIEQEIKKQTNAKYDLSTHYYGAHLGVGKVFSFDESGRLDLFGRVLWNQMVGKEVTTDAGEKLKVKDINSLRTQLGARYNYQFNTLVGAYAGATWDYETNGKVKGTLDGAKIDEPSLKGSTGIGELGVKLTPAQNVSLDLGVHGYLGKREGVGCSAMLNFTF